MITSRRISPRVQLIREPVSLNNPLDRLRCLWAFFRSPNRASNMVTYQYSRCRCADKHNNTCLSQSIPNLPLKLNCDHTTWWWVYVSATRHHLHVSEYDVTLGSFFLIYLIAHWQCRSGCIYCGSLPVASLVFGANSCGLCRQPYWFVLRSHCAFRYSDGLTALFQSLYWPVRTFDPRSLWAISKSFCILQKLHILSDGTVFICDFRRSFSRWSLWRVRSTLFSDSFNRGSMGQLLFERPWTIATCLEYYQLGYEQLSGPSPSSVIAIMWASRCFDGLYSALQWDQSDHRWLCGISSQWSQRRHLLVSWRTCSSLFWLWLMHPVFSSNPGKTATHNSMWSLVSHRHLISFRWTRGRSRFSRMGISFEHLRPFQRAGRLWVYE